MNNLIMILQAGTIGLVCGTIYFVGLYWTVEKGLSSKRPVLLFLGSFLLRSGSVLAVFYFSMDGQVSRILISLAGFVIARIIINRIIRRKATIPIVDEGGRLANEHIT